MSTPKVIVFDVNETLSDMTPMQKRFTEIGMPEWNAMLWFASLLRDGFALAATGNSGRFAEIGESILRSMLAGEPLKLDIDSAVSHIMHGFLELQTHPDVPEGIRLLASADIRLITLSNGSTQVAERLFATAGIREYFERVLSVEEAGAWKPAAAAYKYAASTCSVDPGDMMLVAVHPWDIDGAKRAGLHAAWVNRKNQPYPAHFLAPDHTVTTLPGLAEMVLDS